MKLMKLDYVRHPYAGSIAINDFDLCFNSSNSLVPASSLAVTGTQATDAAASAPSFLGVSHERQLTSSVATTNEVIPDAVSDIACTSASFHVGDMVAPVLNAGNTAFLNNAVIKTTSAAASIGYAVQDTGGNSVTTIRVRLISRLTRNSTNSTDAVSSTSLISTAPTGAGVGYGTGAGGAVTQITTIATGVTLSKLTGQITTVASTLAALTSTQFTVTNTTVAATDIIVLGTTYAGAGSPVLQAVKTVAGAFDILIVNGHATAALNAVLVINFAVIKGVAA